MQDRYCIKINFHFLSFLPITKFVKCPDSHLTINPHNLSRIWTNSIVGPVVILIPIEGRPKNFRIRTITCFVFFPATISTFDNYFFFDKTSIATPIISSIFGLIGSGNPNNPRPIQIGTLTNQFLIRFPLSVGQTVNIQTFIAACTQSLTVFGHVIRTIPFENWPYPVRFNTIFFTRLGAFF